ncbi:MAG: hypothetical protein ACI8XO_000773 [Verrucomicrobiales bacterium]|jgi:hypothetical protein
MPLTSKSASAIAILWVATLAAAFWAGTAKPRNQDPSSAKNRANATGGVAQGGVNQNGFGATGAEGARSLSPALNGRAGGGSAVDRVLRMLTGATGTDLRRSDFRELVEGMSLEEVTEAVGEIALMDPGPAQRDAYTEVLNRWAQLDATAALEHVAGIEAPKFRYDATINVLRHWAAVDPAAAVKFADSNTNNDLPRGSLAAVFRGIGNSMDTTAALGYLASIENEEHQRYAYDTVRELFDRNDAEVIKWTESLPEGKTRDRSTLALIDQWARYDPIAAKAWLAENTSDSNRAGALVELGESWARSDPESAAAWAQNVDTEGARPGKIFDQVFRRWMEYDVAKAAGYLAEQEPSPELDGALEQYIQRIKSVDPDATMAWAESISDPKRRRNAVLQVAKVWRTQDLQAYQSYIANSDVLSEVERNKLLGIRKETEREKPKSKEKKDKAKRKNEARS